MFVEASAPVLLLVLWQSCCKRQLALQQLIPEAPLTRDLAARSQYPSEEQHQEHRLQPKLQTWNIVLLSWNVFPAASCHLRLFVQSSELLRHCFPLSIRITSRRFRRTHLGACRLPQPLAHFGTRP